MDITFFGAAREVTGSCHRLRVGRSTVLLDCGLFQGSRAVADGKNRDVPFAPGDIDAVILSHAHLDHSGRLPLLARLGFTCPIYMTPATRDLCTIMLADSAHLQEKDAEFLARRGRSFVAPLYDQRDVDDAMGSVIAVPLDTPFEPAPGIRATFAEAGHILGSASVTLDCEQDRERRRLVYSGDVGRRGLPMLHDPRPPGEADVVVMESTYGDRDHAPVDDMLDRLAEIVRATAARGGHLLVPAFAVGRAQHLLYDLHRLKRARAIPEIPIVLDSPLAIAATEVFHRHAAGFDRTEPLLRDVADPFAVPGLELARDAEESKAVVARSVPMIVIAGSGMCEGGRILHHLAAGASDPRNTILIAGFQAEHTLGRRIAERRPLIKVFGDEIPLRAEVCMLDGYSAHADRGELREWVGATRGVGRSRLPRVVLVHGERRAQDALESRLCADGFDVTVPRWRERFDL
jgi:metallo-beta-lactamase family protein